MKIILVNRGHERSRIIELGRWSRAVVSLCCLGLPLVMITVGYLIGQDNASRAVVDSTLGALNDDLEQQSSELAKLRDEARRKMRALSLNLAGLQARMTRLDALGEHLTVMADLDDGEFDFSQPPAVGGPLAGEFSVDFSAGELSAELDQFESRMEDREHQLDILQSLLANRKLNEQAWLSGRPVTKGWVSSHYGNRTDPFSGQMAMHSGIDFAGKEGSNVLAVASGVVTWTGTKDGYGDLVEVSHSDGYVTRYAHNQENLVQAGDLVHKGQTIALMGSSGRSTGAHVHFEVFKNGRSVDPSSYVRRTRR